MPTEKGRVGSAVRGYWLRITKVSTVEYWVCECRSKYRGVGEGVLLFFLNISLKKFGM